MEMQFLVSSESANIKFTAFLYEMQNAKHIINTPGNSLNESCPDFDNSVLYSELTAGEIGYQRVYRTDN